MGPDKSQASKMTDIKLYLQKHKLHVLGIIECDLHGPNSRVSRRNPLKNSEIHEKLNIEGYSIYLPQSWYSHGQARVMAYVKEEIKPIIRNVPPASSDLASISLEIGLGKETKTCFNIFYREFTGGVSGLGDLQAQKDRLSRQISHWKSLYGRGKDVVILGDCNLCAMQWDEVSYINKELANMIQDLNSPANNLLIALPE